MLIRPAGEAEAETVRRKKKKGKGVPRVTFSD
jgi:hypothetical protein